MQIQAINFYSKENRINPQFKRAIPVTHWVRETNGSYAPVINFQLSEILQRYLVQVLNRTKKNFSIDKMNYVSQIIANSDKDFKDFGIVRSFSDKKGGYKKEINKFIPISYLITGTDVKLFNDLFGKPIGKARAISPRQKGRLNSGELEIARENYTCGGLKFVKDKGKKLYGPDGIEYTLHTKFEVLRGKRSGKVNGYKLIDLKFCPEKGPENPFVKTGYLSEKDL